MFIKRLISGIVLVVVSCVLFIFGGIPLWLSCLFISLMGQWEYYKATGISKHTDLSFLGFFLTVVYYILIFLRESEYLAETLVISLLIFMVFFVFTFPAFKTKQITEAFFGFCYVPVLMSYIYLTRELTDGRYTVWLILLCSWGCDTLSYCAGMLFGRHKMVTKLSPHKTWEGAIGGILGSAVLGLIYGSIFSSRMGGGPEPVLRCVLACALGAVISIFGDLAASCIKRDHNIKDFGNCIPGHGGILDRFDSVLFTAPVVYYTLMMLSNMM